jgi:hypothetical protein
MRTLREACPRAGFPDVFFDNFIGKVSAAVPAKGVVLRIF